MNFLSELGGRSATGTDGPDGLVGYHHRALEPIHLVENAPKLSFDHFQGPFLLAFLKGFSHTKDRLHRRASQSGCLLGDLRIGFAEDLTPLAMADQRKAASQIFEHPKRDLTCKRAGFLRMEVLGGQGDP